MRPEQNSAKRNLRKGLDLIFVHNPVLITGLALTPVIMGSFTVKNGMGLSLVFGMVTIPVLVLASFLGMLPEKVPQYVRTIACAVLAAVMLIPARILAGGIAPNLFDSLGMYFSMVALNTVWLVCAPSCTFFISSVRELLAYGTFWGNSTVLSIKFPAAAYAFGGFIIVGVAAAVLRWGVDRARDITRLIRRQQKKWRMGR